MRDHHVPGRHLPAREPQARGDLRRRRSRPTFRGATSPSTRMALRLPDAVLVDPFDGAVDLAAGRLRTPLSPEISFSDDPLRMLRAARFIARFGFVPDAELVAAVEAMQRPPRDRERRAHPRRAVEAAARRGPVGRAVVPRAHRPRRRVPARAQLDASSSRTRSTTTRTCSRTRSRWWPRRSPDLVLRLAALFHDVGKPKTRSFERGRA